MTHAHDHAASDFSRAFAIGIGLNLAFVAVEAGYGVVAGSLALVADAGHNLSDVLSLALAWGASLLSAKKGTGKRTYGYKRITIYASLVSAVLLLITLGGITWEAIGRFANPQPVDGILIVVIAIIGVVINSATALLFASGRHRDLNIKGAYLHMAADAGVSLGVAVTGVAVMLTGWFWLDPVVSIAIVGVITFGTWGLLRDSLDLSLDAVPNGVDFSAIEAYLRNLQHVSRIHDLHVWALSTTENALTVHLVISEDSLDNGFIHEIQRYLHDQHGIGHATIQLESANGSVCALNCRECN